MVNLDRISRNDIDEALPLFIGILKAGVSVVTLSPDREYTAESARGNIAAVPEVVVVFALANEGSREKSERVREEWRVRLTRLGEEKETARGPAWLEPSPDRPTPGADLRAVLRLAPGRFWELICHGWFDIMTGGWG